MLEAIQPAGVQAALEVIEQFDQRQDEKRKALQLALEKARYEVDRAQRQYDKVDPANRLVAGELETRWNVALEEVHKLEMQCKQAEERREKLSESEKEQLLELGNKPNRIVGRLQSHGAVEETHPAYCDRRNRYRR